MSGLVASCVCFLIIARPPSMVFVQLVKIDAQLRQSLCTSGGLKSFCSGLVYPGLSIPRAKKKSPKKDVRKGLVADVFFQLS